MNNETLLERLAIRFTEWVGSISSLIVHTIAFIAAFLFVLFGVALDKVLLVLTTALSLEAIYLAIFIQMSVNRQSQSIKEVEEDIDEIQEDVDEIQENIDEIQEDVEGIEEDIVEMSEEEKLEQAQKLTIDKIHGDLQRLLEDFDKLKSQTHINKNN